MDTAESPIILCRKFADLEFVRSLKGHDFLRVVRMTAVLWTQLVLAWVAALYGPVYLVIPAAIVIIVCQQAMVLWVHEGSHFSLAESKRLNDLWTDIFFATPIGMNVQTYRLNHLTHHNNLGTDDDLDRWTFAFDIRGWRGLLVLLELVSGYYGLKVGWQKYGAALITGRKSVQETRQNDRFLMACAWNIALAGACFLAGRWWLYLLVWVYPVLSVTVLLNVVRTMAEHQPAGYDGNPERLASPPTVRTTIPPFWQKWLLYQTNFNYHIEHHTFPFVPFFNLPRLHQHLIERGFYDRYPDLLQRNALTVFARAV